MSSSTRYRPTREECQQGGRTAAALLTTEKRREGGQNSLSAQKAKDPTAFHLAQQERGRRGARRTLETQGPKKLAEYLAAYYREHPTSLERFVHLVLFDLCLDFEMQRVVEVVSDETYWRLDIVVPHYGPNGTDLVIEPGAAYWHNPANDAERCATLATLGYLYQLILTDTEILTQPEQTRQRIRAFLANPRACS